MSILQMNEYLFNLLEAVTQEITIYHDIEITIRQAPTYEYIAYGRNNKNEV